MPQRAWVMQQRWERLLFAHWPVPAAPLRERLPAGVELDLHEGEAWLGVVPFEMHAVRARCCPPLPSAHAFPELNVRTYVRCGDKPGVWFFSLDAASLLAVWGARLLFHLPYFHARMSSTTEGAGVSYASERTHRGAPPARFRARYAPTSEVRAAAPGSLEHFLTERYCLYAADRGGRIYRGEIQHRPWPLQSAELELEHNEMARCHELALPDTSPLCHYAARIEVVVWSLQRVKPGAANASVRA